MGIGEDQAVTVVGAGVAGICWALAAWATHGTPRLSLTGPG